MHHAALSFVMSGEPCGVANAHEFTCGFLAENAERAVTGQCRAIVLFRSES